jgi:hypothetical protein
MTYAASVALYDLIGKILVDVKDGKGVERVLPFTVQYKLNRAATMLSKDFDFISSKKDELIRANGELDEKTNLITVTDEEKQKAIMAELNDAYQMVTEHAFIKLTSDEVLSIHLDDVGFTAQEMGLFIAALVEPDKTEEPVEEPADKSTDKAAEEVEAPAEDKPEDK